MPKAISTKSPITVTVNAEHRNGICIGCGSRMEVREIEGKNRAVCPECGGMTGQLISRVVPIKPPKPPQCLSFKCLSRFMLDSLFTALLSSYHRRRVAYAEANKPNEKTILERYRTGEPAPKNIWQVIHANLKLSCPICRRYDKDPFLFGGKT